MKTAASLAAGALLLHTVAFAETYPALNASGLDPQTPSQTWAHGEHATGNWGGLRDRLKESGVELDLYYTNNPAGNPSGGKKQGFTYTDDFYLRLQLDLEKLMNWRGGHFTISGINRDGRSLRENYVGSQFDPQQVYGGQNIFLYQFVLDQHLFDDKVSLKIGRFGASDDFNSSPVYGFYMTNAIDGDIRNVLFDTQFSAYPFATWASRLRIDPTPEINLQFGVFQTWDRIFDRTHNGLDWSFHSDDGVFLIAQVGWSPEFFKKPVQSESAGDGKTAADIKMKGLPGHYWIGGSYSPWHYTQFLSPEKANVSYGFYAHADQMVYQEKPGSDQGLVVWAASGLYPQENISIMPFQINEGLVYKGLIPGRDEDHTMVGVAYGRFSRDYAASIRSQGLGDPRSEMVIEFGHRIQLAKFAYIQPDFQYIVRPSGTGRIPDAVILGAQMGMTF